MDSGKFTAKVFKLDLSFPKPRNPNTRDLENNALWLQPICEGWTEHGNSNFFWADVFLQLDQDMGGKLLQHSASKTKDAFDAAKDLRSLISYIRSICRNGPKSKTSEQVTKMKLAFLKANREKTDADGMIELAEAPAEGVVQKKKRKKHRRKNKKENVNLRHPKQQR